MNSAMVSLNRLWMSSMLPMFAICNSSRIFSRRAFSSRLRFLLAICNTSCLLLLFYTSQQVYTNYGIVSDKRDQTIQSLPHICIPADDVDLLCLPDVSQHLKLVLSP